ncbi:MAG: glycoside hydrolase [Vicingaceae bacterium]
MKFYCIGLASLFSILLFQCSNSNADYKAKDSVIKDSTNLSKKINGVSFVSPSTEVGKAEIEKPKHIIAANALSFMPYAFVEENSTKLLYNSKWQWWGEKTGGIEQMIELAQAEDYQIMLKPHVWKSHGAYTGKHSYSTEEEWVAFEKNYENYILHYAKLAEDKKLTHFCIGTEWEQFVQQRPDFWLDLIKKVRKIYSGKLSYASNWDEYLKVPFWSKLDLIGVDAYFPLLEAKTASTSELKTALEPYKVALQKLSDSLGKKILFTEYGYRSRDNTTHKPWKADREGRVNIKAQENAYEAFYATFWQESYIAGGFLWKWFPNHENIGGVNNNGFTPQNKPVEKLIFNYYQ